MLLTKKEGRSVEFCIPWFGLLLKPMDSEDDDEDLEDAENDDMKAIETIHREYI